MKLNPPLEPGWEVRPPGELGSDGPAGVTPDGSRILFEIASNSVAGFTFVQLYSAPANGPGAAVRIDHPPLVPEGLTAMVEYKISADSRRVVYTLANKIGDARPIMWLISAPVAGPADAGRVLTFPQPDDFVYEISRDSLRVGLPARRRPVQRPDPRRHVGAARRRRGPDAASCARVPIAWCTRRESASGRRCSACPRTAADRGAT